MEGLSKIDRERILNFLDKFRQSGFEPRRIGDELLKEFSGLWRYRVGQIRIICEIVDRDILIRVVKVGHRRDV